MASDDEYLSELTDIESEEDVDPKNKKKSKKSSWRVRKALTPARATTYSAQALHDQILAGDINLEPEYQREIVWPETKQIMIIDSIFRNFYIPPVIFAVKVHDDGAETKTCIDGKQRLTSLFRFMNGLIPHKDPLTAEKLWFKEAVTAPTKGVRRKMMPEKYRKVFANKQIVCVEYHEISEEDEREVFQRVQLGMALTPAEKLQVINTPRAIFVREIVGKFLREDGALGADSLNWNASRGSDFRCLGHAIHIMDNSTPEKCIMSDFSQVEKWLQSKAGLGESFKDGVVETFDLFAEMVSDTKHGKIFKKYKKVSPIEFVYTAVFIFVYKGTNSLAQLATGLLEMFDHVRTVHQDVRMNNRVQKSFTTFITDWKSKSNVGGVGSSSAQGTKRKRSATTKKKNADDMDVDSDGDDIEDDDDDDDDEYGAPKVKKKASQKSAPPKAPTSKHSEKAAAPSAKIKTEPTPAALPVQKTDRLAAIRRTKEAIAQNQAVQPQPINVAAGQGTTSSNPQMLPSPAQGFALPSAASHPPGQSPVLPGRNTDAFQPLGTAIAANMPWNQLPKLNPNSPFGPNDQPRAPPASSPIVSPTQRERDRDKERERERDRDRRASYDERDRDPRRYEHDRRDSGGYRSRPQDDRDGGWQGSRRR